jgi:hypothetical protein
VDAAIKKDRAAVVSVYRRGAQDSSIICLGPKRLWQPSPDDPLDLEETLEKYLLELSQKYHIAEIYYDPFQFHRSATKLTKRYWN